MILIDVKVEIPFGKSAKRHQGPKGIVRTSLIIDSSVKTAFFCDMYNLKIVQSKLDMILRS